MRRREVNDVSLFQVRKRKNTTKMPPQTSLQFFRKRQTVDSLLIERPQNLQSFYHAVEQSLREIEFKLLDLQTSFYGRTRTLEDEINQWMPALERTMQFAKISDLYCKQHLQDLFDLYERSVGDPTMVVQFDKGSVQAVMELINKVLTVLKTGFRPITEELNNILNFMKKYCLSFVGTEGDSFLETATNYEKQRRDIAEAVKINLDNISSMGERFVKEGIHMQEFGSVAKQIAEKYECQHIPLLVMFPAACENVRNACIGVKKWIQADHGYPTFLRYDLQDLEQKRDQYSKVIRDLQLKASHLDHRIKVIKRDIKECDEDLARIATKEKMLKKQEDACRRELEEVELDIDFRLVRLQDLKNVEPTRPVKEAIDKNISELENLRAKRHVIERKYEDAKRKMQFLKLKRDLKDQKEKELMDVKTEHKGLRKELRKTELEKERLNNNIVKMREIHRFKTSPEVLKKLFYNMPLPTKTKGFNKSQKGAGNLVDKLERASRITASHIEGEWTKLYRALPFYPPRGDENIRIDIDEIGRTFMRDNQETQAKQSLLRWRRMHNRASVDDLKKSLYQLKRKDIVDKIDAELAKRARIARQESLQKAESPSRTVRFPRVLVQPPHTPRSRNSGIMSF